MKKMHTYRQAIVFLVIVQYCLAIGYASDEAGCSHNGTMFADGSLVPSMEPCLSCKCVDSHLKCSLRVCPEQPIPPPRGCVLVQRKLSCCPHVSCKKYHNENENQNRRVITYNSNWYNNDADDLNGDVDERQKAISKNSLYRRIEDEEIDGNDQMCVHNGTIYRTGSAMSTSSLCSYCYCIGGKQKCVRPKCLLTSPGCVPVFIDSSCCPIRYDCGVVAADSTSPLKTKSHFYRIDNKHYNRMRSRAQRNRGCLVASTYYPEGEKLPTDSEKPCDICFCIRGEKICTPKKCAPYIGNCKPKIPEGQCCPANYECDHSDDTPYGDSHRPRQFDLFSYFFSEENAENDTNKEPSEQSASSPALDNSLPISSTSEKSFFDAIRDGLNYIDSNDEHVEKILDSSGINTTTTTNRPLEKLQKNATELSFLDILLSDNDDDDDDEDDEDDDDDTGDVIEGPELHNIAFISGSDMTNLSGPADSAAIHLYDLSNGEVNHDRYAFIDQRPASTVPTVTEHSIKHSEWSPPVKTSSYDRSATERIINEYITYTSVPNYNFESSTSRTNQDFDTSTLTETTQTNTDSSSTQDDAGLSSEAASTEIEGLTRMQTTTLNSYVDNNETDEITTTEPSLVSTFFEEFSHLFGDKNSLNEKHAVNSLPQTIEDQMSTVNIGSSVQVSTQSPSTPKTTRRVYPTIISSSTPQIITITPPTTTTVSTTTTTKRSTSTSSTTTTAPPTNAPLTVIVHASTMKSRPTTTSIPITTSPLTTVHQPSNVTHSTSANPPTTKIILTTTSHPPLIDSNPSILDSDLNYDYGDHTHTLPPSLPNLKIIPFLPTDAVRKDNVNTHPKLDYYSTISTNYPSLTENYESPYLTSDSLQNQNTDFAAFEVDGSDAKDVTFNRNNDNSDFNTYSIESTGYSNDAIFGIPNANGQSPDYNQYPSITEKPHVEQTIVNKYPAYNVDYDYDSFDPEKRLNKYVPGSYEVLDGHEYSVQGRNPSFDKFSTEYPERRVYSKIEFSTSNPLYGYNGNNKFSPPSETEGGFLPKEPFEDDQYYDKLHTTKHLSDIPTTESLPKPNDTGLRIGITSEDPFKNVIRTEPPPPLLTLIEDKEKLFHTVPELSDASIDRDYPSIHLSDIEKEIISITTDSNYNSSPEYTFEHLTDNVEYSLEYSHNDTTSNENKTSVDGVNGLTNTTTKYSTEVSVSSNFQPNPTSDPVPNDFLGSLLGYIFKDNKSNTESKPTEASLSQETQTIPPFKKISSTSLSLMDILNFTKPVENSSKKIDIPQRKNNKIYEYPTTSEKPEETSTPKVENLNILRDVLLATLNSPSSNIDPIAHRDSYPTIDVPKPIYSSHSIHQFLNPIFSGNSELTHVTSKYAPISSEIDLTIPKLNSQIGDNKDELTNNVFGPESYQVLNDYPSISNSRPFGDNPIDYDALKEHRTDENSPNIFTQPLNGFQNSIGILKLAGCNIYGRMYRVGRIITELSNPCLECKCTEVGVHCTTLSC